VSFDRLARHYRWLETLAFGNALQRARTLWIDKIPAPQHVLIVGEGNGRFVCALVDAHGKIDIDCVDASAQMLRFARRRLLQKHPDASDHVRFLHEDINAWQPSDGCYDLVVTHFFLDCFRADEVERIVSKLSRAATKNADWLLADFTVPQAKLTRWHAKIWLGAMYLFFRLVAGIKARRLVDPTPYLKTNGFSCVGRSSSRGGILKSECWRRL
jgi:ubiquinone/menaquinone biosynthesis C-methylase UbiE